MRSSCKALSAAVLLGLAVLSCKPISISPVPPPRPSDKEEEEVKEIKVTGVTLDQSSAEVEVGPYAEYFYLYPEITPEDATNKNVTWTSSDTNVATVSESGRVAVYRVGSATITATTEDGGFTASCTLTVKQKPVVKVTGVEMYYKTRTVKVGEKFDIAATVSPGDATNRGVSWTWTPEELIERYNGVFTYQSHGNVDVIFLAKAPGTVTITIKTSDGSFTDTCEVTITE